MLDIKFIRENKEIVENAIKNKKVKDEIDLDNLLSLADKKKELQQQLDDINAKRNEAAKVQDIEEGKKLKQEGSKLEVEIAELQKQFMKIMLKIPNIPSADTPIGNDEEDNKVVRSWGEPTKFDFKPKAHWDLGPELDIIDKERAAKVTGARFAYIKGDLALLQFALIQFAFDTVTNEDTLKVIAEEADIEVNTSPFVPIVPPAMVTPTVLNRMARLEPKEDRYYLEEDDLFLAGSAEHTIGVSAEGMLGIFSMIFMNCF
jgi:seryl-tRNA synthetase